MLGDGQPLPCVHGGCRVNSEGQQLDATVDIVSYSAGSRLGDCFYRDSIKGLRERDSQDYSTKYRKNRERSRKIA